MFSPDYSIFIFTSNALLLLLLLVSFYPHSLPLFLFTIHLNVILRNCNSAQTKRVCDSSEETYAHTCNGCGRRRRRQRRRFNTSSVRAFQILMPNHEKFYVHMDWIGSSCRISHTQRSIWPVKVRSIHFWIHSINTRTQRHTYSHEEDVCGRIHNSIDNECM